MCVQEERDSFFAASTPDKCEYIADDQTYSGATWKTTTQKRYVNFLNSQSSMPEKTHAIVGEPVAVTCNIQVGKLFIPNGAVGTVTKVVRDPPQVVVDLEHPEPHPNITLTPTTTHPMVGPGKQQLRRTQMPVEMARFMTIHRCQGDTHGCIATCVSSAWAHQLWEREMFFTLLTRVETLSTMHFVCPRCAFSHFAFPPW